MSAVSRSVRYCRMAAVTCCAPVPSILPVRERTSRSPVLLAVISIVSNVWSRKGFQVFHPAPVSVPGLIIVLPESPPADGGGKEEERDAEDDKDRAVEDTLVVSRAAGHEEQEREDEAAGVQVLIGNARNHWHAKKSSVRRIWFALTAPGRETRRRPDNSRTETTVSGTVSAVFSSVKAGLFFHDRQRAH